MQIRKRIDKYKIFSTGTKGSGYMVGIVLSDDTGGFCFIKYLADDKNLPENSLVSAGHYVKLYKHFSQTSVDMDILRNEKPVYLHYDTGTKSGYIVTGNEPVGEHELLADDFPFNRF